METMPQHNWDALKGMSESKAEEYMRKHWGRIPPEWNDPLFRDEVTGVQGGAELSAHMNWGEQSYGGKSRLGEKARTVWYERNFSGQGHPAVPGWLNHES